LESDNFSTGSSRGYLIPTRLDRARLTSNVAFFINPSTLEKKIKPLKAYEGLIIFTTVKGL
jgi:hypothetical protein